MFFPFALFLDFGSLAGSSPFHLSLTRTKSLALSPARLIETFLMPSHAYACLPKYCICSCRFTHHSVSVRAKQAPGCRRGLHCGAVRELEAKGTPGGCPSHSIPCHPVPSHLSRHVLAHALVSILIPILHQTKVWTILS
ncbi:uncharacterized protein BDZ83DRAFT_125906 [Colletotrichum acutatum]|uniref:Secreted protein n=1 Tax=Glomerella acutata TaxID=27357 RepID=A0AAD8URX8_GLOAC|nr:uncharacterized protein BDZ83DRAFT_125906 [Colletotrichum acutatum]KAK1728388.1 hypothetical protein BDZ83DRAFT_125906 [Colletotrichum acutatum]